jgi:hypothetical protein
MAAPKITSDFFGGFSSDNDEEEVEKTIDVEEDLEEEELEEEEDKEDGNTDDSDPTDDPADKAKESDEVDDAEFFTSIINDGAEKGLFYYDPEKEYEGEPEEIFWEVQKDTLDKRFEEEYIDPIPEEYRSILAHLKLGKPLEDWVEAVKPTDYSKINLEDESNQKSLIEQHLALTGMDEDDIKDTLQEYEDGGTLEKNSKKALKYLQKNEDKKAELYEKQLEREEEEAKARQQKELETFKSEVLATEELGKRKLDKKEREKLLAHITEPVNKRGESQFVVNQKSREKQLQLAYLDMIGFDFSKLEKQAETKAASGLRAKLSKTTDLNGKKNGASGRVETESKSLGNWNPW